MNMRVIFAELKDGNEMAAESVFGALKTFWGGNVAVVQASGEVAVAIESAPGGGRKLIPGIPDVADDRPPARRPLKITNTVKRAAPTKKAEPASKVSADARGSRRDACRAALAKNTNGATIESIVHEVQKTFPEMNRTDVGTVLCQLSKVGECELGADQRWVLSV
jgi:hypothetical protein